MGISALLASQILDASATGRSVITGADASAIRTTLGLGTLATQSPTGTPSASTFLRGDYSWQTIDLSGYVPYSGATGAVNLGANAFTASRATLATGTITASTPAINVTQTWNNAATTFTGILANVTDTASNAASLLMDLQTASTTRFRVWKDGSIQNANGAMALATSFSFNWVGGTEFRLTPAAQIIWATTSATSGGSDLVLVREAAQTLAQRNSTSPQVHRWYNTFTDASNYERAKIAWESNVLRIGTEKAGTGSARALELQTDGTTRLSIAATGGVTLSSSLSVSNNGINISNVGGNGFNTSSGGYIIFKSSGVLTLSNALDNDWGRLQFGGTTSSFPAIKRNAAALNFRLADDSADCDITAKAATFSGNVTVSAVNLVTDTTTGTKIGTATTQKLGFFNATPVVQPTAVADATDAASVITQLNALLSRMRDLGLIAT